MSKPFWKHFEIILHPQITRVVRGESPNRFMSIRDAVRIFVSRGDVDTLAYVRDDEWNEFAEKVENWCETYRGEDIEFDMILFINAAAKYPFANEAAIQNAKLCELEDLLHIKKWTQVVHKLFDR